MQAGTIINRIQEDKGLTAKEVLAHLGMGNSKYDKPENGDIDLSVSLLKPAIPFNITTDEILKHSNVLPTGIKVERKPDFEKLHLIN